LEEKNYDQAIDVWSLGCILGELLQHLRKRDTSEAQIFRGKYCHPLSPKNLLKPDEKQHSWRKD